VKTNHSLDKNYALKLLATLYQKYKSMWSQGGSRY